MWNAANCLAQRRYSLLHRAVVMTAYGSGLRIGEACSLRTDDVDSKRKLIHVRDGKRARDRYVPLPDRLRDFLREYWRQVRPAGPFLFPGAKAGRPITPHAVPDALAARAPSGQRPTSPGAGTGTGGSACCGTSRRRGARRDFPLALCAHTSSPSSSHGGFLQPDVWRGRARTPGDSRRDRVLATSSNGATWTQVTDPVTFAAFKPSGRPSPAPNRRRS